jgi:hypothetical protein
MTPSCIKIFPSVDKMMDKVERLYFDEPNSASNAIGYAKHRSRPHDTMIRVYDDAPENMIGEARIASPIAFKIFRKLRLVVSVEGIEGKGTLERKRRDL